MQFEAYIYQDKQLNKVCKLFCNGSIDFFTFNSTRLPCQLFQIKSAILSGAIAVVNSPLACPIIIRSIKTSLKDLIATAKAFRHLSLAALISAAKLPNKHPFYDSEQS